MNGIFYLIGLVVLALIVVYTPALAALIPDRIDAMLTTDDRGRVGAVKKTDERLWMCDAILPNSFIRLPP